jgi:hypothetical protein
MKLIQQSWDFLFGALLIGGAPLSVIALTVVSGDFAQRLLKAKTPEPVVTTIVLLSWIVALVAFVAAIRTRMRRRILPGWLVFAEAILGVAWASFVFALFGVLTYSAIG